jgi:hypothetical protein
LSLRRQRRQQQYQQERGRDGDRVGGHGGVGSCFICPVRLV